MIENKKENWLNWLAISTVVFSACATLSTFKGGGYSTKAILAQSNASDTWEFYQAKSIKQHSYEMQKDLLSLQLPDLSSKMAAAYDAKIHYYDREINRYNAEKKIADSTARAFEQSKTQYQSYGSSFGLAMVFLQVAIMLSAIAALLKKEYVWYIGLGLGLIGLVYFADGFLQFLA